MSTDKLFSWLNKNEKTDDENWLDELDWLAARFSGLGIGPDLASMGYCELRGLYCFLRRQAGG